MKAMKAMKAYEGYEKAWSRWRRPTMRRCQLWRRRHHSWSASGIPSTWGPVTFREWLEAQGWSIMDCTAPKGRNRPWSFRGRYPAKLQDRSFSYKIRDDFILIKRWEKKRAADEETKPINGQYWWTKDATFDDPIETDDPISLTKTWTVAPTVPDSGKESTQMEQETGGNTAEKSKAAGATGNSPPKKKLRQSDSKKKDDPDRITGGMPGPSWDGKRTTVIDTGGAGWLRMACFEFCSSWHK